MNMREAGWLAGMIVSLAALPVMAQSVNNDQPWRATGAVLVIDPYELNDIQWNAAAADPKLKAVIHRASIGARVDKAFLVRAAEAHKRGLLWGAYHLGRAGSPVTQADLLRSLAKKTGATFLALDIEGLGGPNMSLDDAQIFINRIHDKTGNYPALYVNWSVYEEISRRYDRKSTFAKTPLWIARFTRRLPSLNAKVWSDYTFWQFASELNCPKDTRALRKPSLCSPYRPYHLAGVQYDMDVNVFNGGPQALARLFGTAH